MKKEVKHSFNPLGWYGGLSGGSCFVIPRKGAEILSRHHQSFQGNEFQIALVSLDIVVNIVQDKEQ
jgi:hypothetical protein